MGEDSGTTKVLVTGILHSAETDAVPSTEGGAVQQTEFVALIPTDKQGRFLSVVGFVVVVLYEFTKTPGALTKPQ